jgi:hypothetical protein
MQSALWVGLTLAAPAAAKEIYRRLGSRLGPWAAEIAFWSNAAYGILPLYGAWISGAVIGRDCGIAGISPAAWLSGIAVCGLILGCLAVSLRMRSVDRLIHTWYNPQGEWLTLFDEPRWAFYRGAGTVAVPDAGAAQLIGLVLGVLEWAIRGGRPVRDTPPQVWFGLIRLGMSAGLFALTHNLWLILITQAAAHALILRSREPSSSSG